MNNFERGFKREDLNKNTEIENANNGIQPFRETPLVINNGADHINGHYLFSILHSFKVY